jgi:Uncharacterized protein conserved in bacteria (DUF2066)
MIRWIAACFAVFFIWAAGPTHSAGPVETSIFAVTGVEVDVTDTDAATAKTRAVIEAQVKAFYKLAERLGSEEAVKKLADVKPDQIGRMLRSLSIEEEHTGPGRYIGKLTIRFLPGKIRKTFSDYGVPVVEDQAPPMVVLPVWKTPQGPVIWEENVWRKAWLDLHAEQATMPIIIPLGDLEDTQAISAEEALALDDVKLQSVKIRYAAKSILVAIAEPDGNNGVHVIMSGDSPLGKVTFDKVYTADEGTVEASAALAAKRFQSAMLDRWRQVRLKVAAEAKARADAERAAAQQAAAEAESAAAPQGPRAVSISVPFKSPVQWNAIRGRLVGTPGVVGVNVSSIAVDGAVIRLTYAKSLQNLQDALSGSGLRLQQVGGKWVLQPG